MSGVCGVCGEMLICDRCAETDSSLAIANRCLRKIHAILTNEAIEVRNNNYEVVGHTAELDSDTMRELMALSSGLGHDEG